jgi:hypothetical protein
MKRKLVLLILPLIFFSCKKIIQQQEENAVIQIMTSGVWYVQTFDQNDSTITPSFSGYTFQFYANGTVVAIKNGATAATGTWAGNINNQTITSNFPSSGDPLDKLNSVWTITDSGTNYVVAFANVGGSYDNLRLQK